MYCVLSPAKKIAKVPTVLPGATKSLLLDQTALLAERMKALSSTELQQLMGISPALAELNRQRFLAYTSDHQDQSSAGLAIFQFEGDVYRYFNPSTLSEDELFHANKTIGILSGFYGLLRPMDLMQPYRLEMGTSLLTHRGQGLYRFWGNRVTECIQSLLGASDLVLNLASEEYAKVVDWTCLNHWTVAFKEQRGGALKTIGVNAKRARGAMARWVVDHQPKTINDLFDATPHGYQYHSYDSENRIILFIKA